MNKLKGFFALLFAGIIYSFNDIAIRILGSQVSGYQQVTLRSSIAVIFIICVFFFKKSKFNIKYIPRKYLIMYGLFFALSFVFFNASILLTKVADTVFSFFIGSILFSLIVERFVYKRKITKIQMISTLITLTGLSFFSFPISKTSINAGFLLGLASGITYTVINTLIRHVDKKIDKFILVAAQMAGGIIIAGSATILSHQPLIPTMSLLNILILFITGMSIMLVTYLILIGFQNFDLHLGTIIISSELFFAPLFAFIIFKERLTVYEIIGGILIGLAIILPQVPLKHVYKKTSLNQVQGKL